MARSSARSWRPNEKLWNKNNSFRGFTLKTRAKTDPQKIRTGLLACFGLTLARFGGAKLPPHDDKWGAPNDVRPHDNMGQLLCCGLAAAGPWAPVGPPKWRSKWARRRADRRRIVGPEGRGRGRSSNVIKMVASAKSSAWLSSSARKWRPLELETETEHSCLSTRSCLLLFAAKLGP